MSQHDFDIANQGSSDARSDINNALQALATNSSGGDEPTTTYAGMFWFDETNGQLKMRTQADDNWIILFNLDQTNLDANLDDSIVSFSNLRATLVANNTQAEAGTNDSTLMTPAKTAAAIAALGTAENLTANAMLEVSAGTNIIKALKSPSVDQVITTTSVVDVGVPFTALRSCEVRVSVTAENSSGTASAYVRVNGTTQSTLSFTSTETTQTVDVTLAAGDVLEVAAQGNSASNQFDIREVYVMADSYSFVGV